MKQMYSNATVSWNEAEIIRRESLIREIPIILQECFLELNPIVQFVRCETPVIVPKEILISHIEAKFELLSCGERGFLRPETTAGTYEYFNKLFPHKSQLMKRLPYCVWQVGLSFRDEQFPDTMRASKLRLIQFYQMEFQLFCREDTKANYLEAALKVLTDRYGGDIVFTDDLPHYSEKTIDWHINGLEVAGCSIRNDWEHGKVFEIAIGLDRLIALGK